METPLVLRPKPRQKCSGNYYFLRRICKKWNETPTFSITCLTLYIVGCHHTAPSKIHCGHLYFWHDCDFVSFLYIVNMTSSCISFRQNISLNWYWRSKSIICWLQWILWTDVPAKMNSWGCFWSWRLPELLERTPPPGGKAESSELRAHFHPAPAYHDNVDDDVIFTIFVLHHLHSHIF